MGVAVLSRISAAAPFQCRKCGKYRAAIVEDVALRWYNGTRLCLKCYIRCEMTPTSVGGEQQISISGGSQSPI